VLLSDRYARIEQRIVRAMPADGRA
jgi:hypothetical protein